MMPVGRQMRNIPAASTYGILEHVVDSGVLDTVSVTTVVVTGSIRDSLSIKKMDKK